MDDLISVIIAAYNSEKFIRRCLLSVISQTHQNLEIIVIDDGSTDKTVDIIRSINDSRIRLIQRQQNYGISLTRNHGIDIAKGKYIGFIDADDFIDPDFYQKLYQRAIQTNAEITTTATSAEWPHKTKKWAGIPGVYHHFSDKLTAVRNGSCWNKIYLTQFLRQNNLKFPAGLISEDNFFVIKSLAICQKLAVINNTYYHYIMNPSSLTHDPKIEGKRKNDNLIISCMILEFIKQNIPQARKQVIHFILKNIIAYRYLADNAYYLKLRKAAGFSFTLLKARLFALYDARKKKI